ncbi:MAG: hypothetical protein ACREJM_15620, partial [Candidatus Saccharimonadales bacterium]
MSRSLEANAQNVSTAAQQSDQAHDSLFDRALNDSALARVAAVTGEGLYDAVPAAINAGHYDLSHFKTNMLPQLLGTAALTVGMRLAFPEAQAMKAIGGTLFGLFFAKNALQPTFNAWRDVAFSGNSATVAQAAHQMGDGLGSFGWNMVWNLPVAGAVDYATGKSLGLAVGSQKATSFDNWKTDQFQQAGEKIHNRISSAGNLVRQLAMPARMPALAYETAGGDGGSFMAAAPLKAELAPAPAPPLAQDRGALSVRQRFPATTSKVAIAKATETAEPFNL